MAILQKVPKNTDGRDFVVGDLHGHYDDLMSSLEELSFDKSRDRLFSVGDMIDRGPDSLKCLNLIFEPWFFAVRGNHEQLMIDAVRGAYENAPLDWHRNGGSWIFQEDELYGDALDNLVAAVDELPYAIEIDGRIGIVHAEPPVLWEMTKLRGAHQEEMLWGRDRIGLHRNNGYRGLKIDDIEHVFVGHTIVKDITVLHNVSYIDAGSYKTGKLFVLDIEQYLDSLPKQNLRMGA